MFDFFRNFGKSAAEKRQERVNAFLDGELSPQESRRFEAELDQDPDLRTELAELRQIKRSLQQLPQVRAPRNYTLDPAVYGTPAPEPASQWLPALRVATALTAFFFILTVALDVFTVSEQVPHLSTGAQEAEVAGVVVEEVEVEGEAVAVTRVVTEVAEEPVEEEVEMAEDAALLAPAPTEEPAAGVAAVEEGEEVAEEVPEAVEEEAVVEEVPEVVEEEAVEGDVADEDEVARDTAADETGAREPEIAAAPAAEETADALFLEQDEGEAEIAEAPEDTPAEVAVEVPGPSFSWLRVAQIALGFLLAGLLAAWALARR